MTNDKNKTNDDVTRVQPFNDVTEHYQKIMGMPNQRPNVKSMPKWLRIFYFLISGFVITALLIILATVFFR